MGTRSPAITTLGRSPRARRSRSDPHQMPCLMGSISASAEEPAPPRGRESARWVDLRERGGAPRRRGVVTLDGGRSPRARRSPRGASSRVVRRGSISASAEEPAPSPTRRRTSRVDLRERGGADLTFAGDGLAPGRSPRARRSRRQFELFGRGEGSISASAEEPASRAPHSVSGRVDLRERGGAASPSASLTRSAGRSPRARRSRGRAAPRWSTRGSISASAEEPARTGRCRVRPGVDLRERGGAEKRRDATP